jgi:phosphoglycolate phosphatase
MNFENILFDLDGTLIDPKTGITRSVQHALNRLGISGKTAYSLESFIGPPLKESFRNMYGLSPAKCSLAVSWYREYFSERGMYECTVYPGIPEMLQDLLGEGRRLIIATTKPTVFAEKILTYFRLSGFFSGLIGSNLDGSRADKGEIIAHALSELCIRNKTRTVMIGDRMYDIEGARTNDIQAIAVGYGYGNTEELHAARPDFTVETVNELHQLLIDCPPP